MSRIGHLWSGVRSSFWFVPSVMVLGSITLAVALILIESANSDRWLARWPLLLGAGADGARAMMSTIAGSMITVVGVTFSTILVVLALASSQYTSRILRNFMRSRVTQIVLGVFTSIFTYCLIVLRSIRSGDDGAFVPNMAVSFGFVMALAGVGALIFFIHHIASSIQASSIISSVARETIAAIDGLYLERTGQVSASDSDEELPRAEASANWQPVMARKSGYIQKVNAAALLRLANDMQTAVRMEHAVGEFVVEATPLASVALEAPLEREAAIALQAAFGISGYRTVEQDATFGIRQIVDVALKALSPGVTDTTTAVMCIDYLTAILAKVAPRQLPSFHRYQEGELQLLAKSPTFESLLAESFDQIRGKSGGDTAILLRLLSAFATLAGLTTDPDRRRLLWQQVRSVAELAERTVESPHDRATIQATLERVDEALQAAPPTSAPVLAAAGAEQ